MIRALEPFMTSEETVCVINCTVTAAAIDVAICNAWYFAFYSCLAKKMEKGGRNDFAFDFHFSRFKNQKISFQATATLLLHLVSLFPNIAHVPKGLILTEIIFENKSVLTLNLH